MGCNTGSFVPRSHDDPKVHSIREALGVSDDQLMILTAGGDAASKGGQEVMRALATLDIAAPNWRYVCKVWPQARTVEQNTIDLQLAADLGIGEKVVFRDQCGLAEFHALLASRLRYLRCTLATGGLRNDSGGG